MLSESCRRVRDESIGRTRAVPLRAPIFWSQPRPNGPLRFFAFTPGLLNGAVNGYSRRRVLDSSVKTTVPIAVTECGPTGIRVTADDGAAGPEESRKAPVRRADVPTSAHGRKEGKRFPITFFLVDAFVILRLGFETQRNYAARRTFIVAMALDEEASNAPTRVQVPRPSSQRARAPRSRAGLASAACPSRNTRPRRADNPYNAQTPRRRLLHRHLSKSPPPSRSAYRDG